MPFSCTARLTSSVVSSNSRSTFTLFQSPRNSTQLLSSNQDTSVLKYLTIWTLDLLEIYPWYTVVQSIYCPMGTPSCLNILLVVHFPPLILSGTYPHFFYLFQHTPGLFLFPNLFHCSVYSCASTNLLITKALRYLISDGFLSVWTLETTCLLFCCFSNSWHLIGNVLDLIN